MDEAVVIKINYLRLFQNFRTADSRFLEKLPLIQMKSSCDPRTCGSMVRQLLFKELFTKLTEF